MKIARPIIKYGAPGTFYVSPEGNDTYSGSIEYPVATVNQALTLAATYQAGDNNKPVLILVDYGDYSYQTITINNTDLVNVHIATRAKMEDPIYFNSIQCTSNNADLQKLFVEGLTFTSSCSFTCSTDGANNHFGENVIAFFDCDFDGTTTFTAVNNVSFWRCQASSFTAKNVYYLFADQDTDFKSGLDNLIIHRDGNESLPNLLNSADYQYFSVETAEAPKTLVVKSVNGATKTIYFLLRNVWSVGTSVELGAGVATTLYPGSYIYSPSTTNNGVVYLYGGQYYDIESASGSGSVSIDSILYASEARSNNFYITPEGGFAIKLINKTGGASVKGTVVRASTSTNGAFDVAPTDSDEPIGVVYNAGIADGSSCWVVVSGIAQVLMENSSAATKGYWVYTSNTTAGRAKMASDPTGEPAHWKELGHCIETKSGGTNVLSKCILHFN